jgi:hypothetical protein
VAQCAVTAVVEKNQSHLLEAIGVSVDDRRWIVDTHHLECYFLECYFALTGDHANTLCELAGKSSTCAVRLLVSGGYRPRPRGCESNWHNRMAPSTSRITPSTSVAIMKGR